MAASVPVAAGAGWRSGIKVRTMRHSDSLETAPPPRGIGTKGVKFRRRTEVAAGCCLICKQTISTRIPLRCSKQMACANVAGPAARLRHSRRDRGWQCRPRVHEAGPPACGGNILPETAWDPMSVYPIRMQDVPQGQDITANDGADYVAQAAREDGRPRTPSRGWRA